MKKKLYNFGPNFPCPKREFYWKSDYHYLYLTVVSHHVRMFLRIFRTVNMSCVILDQIGSFQKID